MSKIAYQSIPMPARKLNAAFGKRGSKYDLAGLVAGSDQAIVLSGIDSKKDHSKLSSAVANYRKTGGTGKFTIRTIVTKDENGVEKTSVGLWKLED